MRKLPCPVNSHPENSRKVPYAMFSSDDSLIIPVVIENLVTHFKYWDNAIQDGIQYQGDLYTRIKTYSQSERLKAFSEGQEYVSTGSKVCITVAKYEYTIWVELRSR